jgi:hypothetical protein
MPSLSPQWTECTNNLIVDSLPSISVSTERADVPLTMTVSDFSVTLDNSGNEIDALFDISKIVGPIPPISGSFLRAPLVHLGKVLFCRIADTQPLWEVVFFGYIDPVSVRFNRTDKTVSMTAYAPGKLLELGNAARVNKISTYSPAPPFVLPSNAYFQLHPVVPPGGIEAEPSWWALNFLPSLPLVAGDRFRAVRIPAAGWVENESLTNVDDTEFTIKQVVPDFVNNLLYFQTEEEPDLVLGFTTATMEITTPWYRSTPWEDLVQLLVAEVNAALISVGYTDDSVLVVTKGLPLLPAASVSIAQLINMDGVSPPINGVDYAFWGSTRYLFFSYQPNATHTTVGAKSDILGPLNLGPITVPVFAPGLPVGYLAGPDDNQPVRYLSSSPMLGGYGSNFNAGPGGNNVSLCGQDIHSYNNAGGNAAAQTFDSTHWCRSPAGMFSGTEPKSYYRAYARGRYFRGNAGDPATAGFRRGIEITKFTTADSGATWVIDSNIAAMTTVPLDSDPNGFIEPSWGTNGTSSQIDFKCFQLSLGGGSYLFCWTDPYKGEAYFKTSATGEDAATVFNPPPATFISPGPDGDWRPTAASGFVTEGIGKGIFFFCDRADGNGILVYIWNGTTFTPASFNAQLSLTTGDFINAIIDSSRSKFYLPIGKTVMEAQYNFNVGLAQFNWIGNVNYIQVDSTNYDPVAERQANSILRPGALLWLTGPVIQNFPQEPDYTNASDSLIAASQQAIYIIANTPANLVDYADFSGLSVAGALQEMILVRGYQMITQCDLLFVADPALYNPQAVVKFRQRLANAPSVIDLTAPVNLCESCEDGIWILNYVAVGVQNSQAQPPLGPFFNNKILTNLGGASFLTNPPRNAPSSALLIDNRFLGTSSFAQLLANIYAQDFLIPQPDATISIVDPYAAGYGLLLLPLDVVKYLKRPPDSSNSSPLYGQGRIFSIDYGLDVNQLTIRVG